MFLDCKFYNARYELNMLIRNDEIIFHLPNGKEIASLSVCAMIDEDDNVTENFFLTFKGKDCPESKDTALCIL